MDKGKKGGVLVLALLVMFVGAIILGGLFMYLDTSLLLATKGEENAVNYYAADSGIEDAILWLQHEPWLPHEEPLAGWNVSCDPLDPEGQPCENAYSINGRDVTVKVVNPIDKGFGNDTFKITSTATADSGARTEIISYIQMASLDFYRYGEDAITTNCSAMIRGQKTSIKGNVTYVCDVTCKGDPPASDFCPDEEDCCIETVNGTVRQDTKLPPGIDWWPATWALVKYFSSLAEAQDAVHITGDYEIDMVDPSNANLGPLYVEGNLLMKSSSKNIEHATLNGIVYVNGDLTIKGANPGFTLDLNDQVIFVEGNGENTYDIYIDQDCNMEGSGAIITIGDIYFEPKMTTGPDDFIFIMSLEGSVLVQPNGDFYGSIAGQDVNVQPNLYIERTDSADFWGTLPDTDVNIIKILTYDIIDQ